MKLMPFCSILALLLINFLVFPLDKVYAITAFDIVCEFKYKIGDQPRVWAEASGTTLMQARKSRKRDIELLKQQAEAAGLSFQAVSLFC
jgi:hypothetical protein